MVDWLHLNLRRFQGSETLFNHQEPLVTTGSIFHRNAVVIGGQNLFAVQTFGFLDQFWVSDNEEARSISRSNGYAHRYWDGLTKSWRQRDLSWNVWTGR